MNKENEWREKKVSLGGAIISAAVTLAIGIIVGIYWDNISATFLPYLGFKKVATTDWSELNEVYSELSSYYDGEINKQELIEGAKKGMTEALGDPYTTYYTAKEAVEFNKNLHGDVGAGIGVEMAKREDYIRVVRTLPDNPARKAGILAGDIIYKVDGEEVWDKDIEVISSLIRGESGTEVKVSVVRDGKELEFTMTREIINNVSYYINYDDTIAIITVTRFDTDTGTAIQREAAEFSKKGIDKIILDLRNNGGGYVDAANDLLSLWLDGEKTMIEKSKNALDSYEYASRGKATLKDMKTVVLVNNQTVSASEITAVALKEYNKATIVGETTYGKGVTQILRNLSNGTMIKITNSHWYSPLGNSINGYGIIPDVECTNTYEDINAGRDPQMDTAKKIMYN